MKLNIVCLLFLSLIVGGFGCTATAQVTPVSSEPETAVDEPTLVLDTATSTPTEVVPTATVQQVASQDSAADTPTPTKSDPTATPNPNPTPTTVIKPEVDMAELNMSLIAAARDGDVATVQELLAQGASVHASDEQGVTALIAAAYENHLEVAKILIEAGADVNVKDNTQQSAYLIPTAYGYFDMLKLTLEAGGDVHSRDSYNGTGLIRAADRGHVEIIEELLKTDIDIDHVNRLGWTALLEAIILGDGGPRHTEVVRLLVEAGADVNLADGGGITPLAHAQQRGFEEIASILQAAGATR